MCLALIYQHQPDPSWVMLCDKSPIFVDVKSAARPDAMRPRPAATAEHRRKLRTCWRLAAQWLKNPAHFGIYGRLWWFNGICWVIWLDGFGDLWWFNVFFFPIYSDLWWLKVTWSDLSTWYTSWDDMWVCLWKWDHRHGPVNRGNDRDNDYDDYPLVN